uniref:Ribulose-5-phosphate 4-epimerase and related epimerases and aldolases n=1 Tax=uncultured Thiotrichaceae bacterium TaxID=298394 RepID=A0A6S6U3Z5_9GAMM|nr:MAG: Ribulose-5-phosphate 4-epimerase and related epimerases and aldolases [uncultured Thiotrichaceae bacterium]
MSEVSTSDFENPHAASAAEWQTRIDLAAMFRITQMMGWDDTVWNHITARVPGTDHQFFMHRFGLLYEEVTASNLIKVDEHGKVLEGPPDVNTAGFVIHSAIHLNHPDNHFVFHAHPPSAIAATAFKDGIPFLVQDSSMLYNKIGYHDWEGLSVDLDERFRIAENLGDNKCLVMRNHGFLTVGHTAGEAFMNMYYLIRLCEVALQAEASNLTIDAADKKLWELSCKQYEAFSPGLHEWPALLRRCDRADPSYKH